MAVVTDVTLAALTSAYRPWGGGVPYDSGAHGCPANVAGHKRPVECDRRGKPPVECDRRAHIERTASMPEAVIVDAVRTPVGRAFKGSLASLRPDETLAFVIDQLLERNPGVDPSSVEEVIAGCGLPQGLQANNIARIAVLLSDKLGQKTNGSTVSRYCASGLDAIRIAANAVAAGQGDVYIAAGVEFVSRYNAAQEAAHPEDQNEDLQGKEPGQPNAYIAMGLTAENVAEKYGVTREDQDAYAQRSQERAVAAQETASSIARSCPSRSPTARSSARTTARAPTRRVEKLGSLKPAFKQDGTVTAGNSCPLNDGAAAALS